MYVACFRFHHYWMRVSFLYTHMRWYSIQYNTIHNVTLSSTPLVKRLLSKTINISRYSKRISRVSRYFTPPTNFFFVRFYHNIHSLTHLLTRSIAQSLTRWLACPLPQSTNQLNGSRQGEARQCKNRKQDGLIDETDILSFNVRHYVHLLLAFKLSCFRLFSYTDLMNRY